jgi:hypothetical protein
VRVTNAERGDLIDALKFAIDVLRSSLDDELAPGTRQERSDQMLRYRVLRKRLLAEERAA